MDSSEHREHHPVPEDHAARPLPDRQRWSWSQYFQTAQQMNTELERRLHRQSILRLADYQLVHLLYDAPDYRKRLGELAREMSFSPSRLSYQINNLTEKSLVLRIEDPSDGRAAFAELTAKGVDTFLAAREVHRQNIRELVMEVLTEEEIDAMGRIFAKIRGHISTL